ncbi:M48 family metallopeptidase [Mariprofundus ferrooxydans]|uniref:M48 family metallopeptidase n=1 Tax=Mariprofundus ferrooxydans TaxID=314344 RepID=UPI00037945DC|nr:M48 family metallopeptidase [Mariprofundus ferrooxydans]
MVDFFGQQEQARRQTSRLVILFAVAVVLIVLAVYLAVTAGLFIAQFFQGQHQFFSVHTLWNPMLFVWVSGLTLLLIGGGSWYRLHSLKQGGGRAVAELLGGTRIPSATSDPLLRRLLNIIAEMAIASGVPVPPAYLLEQPGINAFAAGFAPGDSVIAVTRGALDLLDRDQLQGVIAHEFSHILNGDTRLKMRLMGLLFGVTLISDAGIMLLSSRRTIAYSSRERGTHPAVLAIGFLLFLAGTIGAVFADLIKRAVSRQREFLADAAAVQFTRNPAGIAGALKLIGGCQSGSRVVHPAAQQASHFFFGDAMKNGQAQWWATHPPLTERIRRLDPTFRGVLPPVDAVERSRVIRELAVSELAMPEQAVPVQPSQKATTRSEAIASVGQIESGRASGLLVRLPERLRHFARDPFTARAIVYAMLLDEDTGLRRQQLDALQVKADADVFSELLDIQPLIAGLDPDLRIPLLELLMPALKELSGMQYRIFRGNVKLLIKANEQLSMREYMLHRMLLRHLAPAFEAVQPAANKQLGVEAVVADLGIVVAMLVRLGRHVQPAKVYRQAMEQVAGAVEEPMPRADLCTMARLDASLNHLRDAAPSIQQQVVASCAAAVIADGHVSVRETEMLRAVCDALECPMPPLAEAGLGF